MPASRVFTNERYLFFEWRIRMGLVRVTKVATTQHFLLDFGVISTDRHKFAQFVFFLCDHLYRQQMESHEMQKRINHSLMERLMLVSSVGGSGWNVACVVQFVVSSQIDAVGYLVAGATTGVYSLLIKALHRSRHCSVSFRFTIIRSCCCATCQSLYIHC